MRVYPEFWVPGRLGSPSLVEGERRAGRVAGPAHGCTTAFARARATAAALRGGSGGGTVGSRRAPAGIPSRSFDAASPLRWLPGLRVLRSYDPAWLRHDLVAGLVLTTMLVPVGIAYADASGV